MPASAPTVDLATHPLTHWTGPLGLPDFIARLGRRFRPGLRCGAGGASSARSTAIAGNAGAADDRQHAGRAGALAATRWTASRRFSGAAPAPTPTTRSRRMEREISPKMARHFSAISMNAALFARIDALYRAARGARARCRDAARAGEDLEELRPRRREARREPARSGLRRSTRSWLRSARTSARTCWPTRRTGCCSSTRATSPACPSSCASAMARRPRRAARRAATPSRCRARSTSPSPAFSERRDLREKAFRAFAMRGENGGETDNAEVVRRRSRCAPKRRGCSAMRAMPR